MTIRSGQSFSVSPDSLRELLSLPADQLAHCDLARANLLCAEGLPGCDSLDIRRYQSILDKWAAHIQKETQRHSYRVNHPRFADHYHRSPGFYRLSMLGQVMHEDFGVRYNPARVRDPDFRNPKDLFIHGMIEDSNGGTCASMPVLYTAIARRLGYPLFIVGAKGHLFCRWDGKNERFNFEGAGKGCSRRNDEYYHTWPIAMSQVEINSGQYLRSITQCQEIAGFMAARAWCLEDWRKFDQAAEAYRQAIRLDPGFSVYRGFLERLLLRETQGIIYQPPPIFQSVVGVKPTTGRQPAPSLPG